MSKFCQSCDMRRRLELLVLVFVFLGGLVYHVHVWSRRGDVVLEYCVDHDVYVRAMEPKPGGRQV